MKRNPVTAVSLAMLFVALALPIQFAAQNNQDHNKHMHHHYQLVDVKTFGGPNSTVYVSNGVYAPRSLNNQGVVAGWAETSTSDPFAPNFCFNADCYVSHTLQWKNGVSTDLGTLGGGSSDAVYISDSGLIVSDAETGGTDPLVPGSPEFHAQLWKNGNLTDLGTLPQGGYESFPSAVNNHGQVVGFATNTVPDPNAMPTSGFPYPYQSRAFLWQKGVMQDLGTLGTGTDAQASYINDRGQVVGYSYTSSAPSTACANYGYALATGAFVWEKGKGMKDLGSFGGTCTLPAGLNNRGQVVGWSFLTGDQAAHAFVWDRTTGLVDLGKFAGDSTFASAINENGDIVGGSNIMGVCCDAVLWQERAGKRRMTDLGTVNGANCSYGLSINASGQVVGDSGDFCGTLAFLWENGGPAVDLNTLVPPNSGLYIFEAGMINDRGEITVNSWDANFNNHALLLIPCDGKHPGVEGCDYSMVDGSAAAAAGTARLATLPTTARDNSSPIGPRGQFRGRSAHRFPGFGVQPQK